MGADRNGREPTSERGTSEAEATLGRPGRLDAAAAERLLAGEDVGFADLSHLLAAASAPARPEELAGETGALVAFRYAALGASGGPRRRSTAKPMWARLASVKVAAIAVALATTGVALAAGTGVLPTPFKADPPTAAPDRTSSRPGGNPGDTGPTTTGALGGPGAITTGPAPSTTLDPTLVGLCRAYRAQAKSDPEKVLDKPTFERLVAAAGGRDKVEAYCDQLLGDKTAKPTRPPRGPGHATGPPPSPDAAQSTATSTAPPS
jgi:hypothetical protein